MTAPADLEAAIAGLLAGPPYGRDPSERERALRFALQALIKYACELNPAYSNYVRHWPLDFQTALRISDLPFLPVGVFKQSPPLALVPPDQITAFLSSSATTAQIPSRIAVDAATSRRMTRGLTAIIRDFIGPARRPYLVVDTPANIAGGPDIGARGAAIQGLRLFATETLCCLRTSASGELELDRDRLAEFASRYRNAEVLVYGFTYVIWNHCVQPLADAGIHLTLPRARVLHSGGWKRLQRQAVTKETFIRGVAQTFGCPPEQVVDFYGLVENVGVVYPDCPYGNKHAPAFAEIIIRDPLTLAPVTPGGHGFVQVCSALPTSFPGFLVLTQDMGELVYNDRCACGRRGVAFRFIGRAPNAETRGCGNLETTRDNAAAATGDAAPRMQTALSAGEAPPALEHEVTRD